MLYIFFFIKRGKLSLIQTTLHYILFFIYYGFFSQIQTMKNMYF